MWMTSRLRILIGMAGKVMYCPVCGKRDMYEMFDGMCDGIYKCRTCEEIVTIDFDIVKTLVPLLETVNQLKAQMNDCR